MRTFASLLLLGALFGSAFPFIRIGVETFGPFTLMALRALLAVALLLAWRGLVRARNESGGRPVSLSDWLWLGALNAALPHTLVAFAELHVSAAVAALLMGTIPLLTAVVAALWLREPLRPRQLAGLLLGLAGVALLAGWDPQRLGPHGPVAVAALVAATVSYALGGVFAQVRFREVAPTRATIGTFLASGLLLLPAAAAGAPAGRPEGGAVLALMALALLPTALAFVLEYRLIQRVGAATVALTAYLVPLFGAVFGVVLLGERLGPAELAGAAVVLGGSALAAGARLPRRSRSLRHPA